MLRSIGLIAGLLAATASVAGEKETLCQTAGLVVKGETTEARDRICHIAAREIPKLAACNVAVPEGVTIKFEHTLPEGCMGIFHCGEALISLLPPDLMAECRAPERAFVDVPDRPFFDSVVVHELTHAAYYTVECPFKDCLATAEYAAYAMQVRSLPPDAREAFEATSAYDQRIARDELNAIFYAFAPDRFAQKAWLHFTQRDDGCELIRQIMDGAVFFDWERF
ncbi:DUF6639 family protein [Palleronia pelagia]|uniref:Uncharacterized protein n=1 Tax=Palleronia pelagia TaxID=387096 RepID=A0A1H8D2A9_9RHOB|nr:DUF6639 family protein [Palleronia pelagia]SEN00834.1 hypothetical protein SAMN04488011_102154 [Palleronia pelagia]